MNILPILLANSVLVGSAIAGLALLAVAAYFVFGSSKKETKNLNEKISNQKVTPVKTKDATVTSENAIVLAKLKPPKEPAKPLAEEPQGLFLSREELMEEYTNSSKTLEERLKENEKTCAVLDDSDGYEYYSDCLSR